MATLLSVKANLVDANVNYATTPADFITLDLVHDYLIWSEDLEDLLTHEPTSDELNEHGIIIDENAVKLVPEYLVMDYSHDWNGAYYTHLVKGMGENKRYVLCFSFDGATANEPQLEAWDDSDHDSSTKHVLGAGTPANSMVKAICTTGTPPGANWATSGAGIAIAGSGATRIIKLNDGNGALDVLESGEISQEVYANIAVVIPQAYATPAVESFILTVRYTWN
jgi:hypothetical protein